MTSEEQAEVRAAALEEAAAMLDEWVDADVAEQEHHSAEVLGIAAECIRGLKVPGETIPCSCEGCPSEVPAASRSGLCGPCVHVDCEHEEDSILSTPRHQRRDAR